MCGMSSLRLRVFEKYEKIESKIRMMEECYKPGRRSLIFALFLFLHISQGFTIQIFSPQIRSRSMND